MSEIENKEELPLPLSETSLYSTCHINSSKTQENSTTAACADVEDVENDGLKKWELIAWDEYKKCEIYSQRAYANLLKSTTLPICLCLFKTHSSVSLNACRVQGRGK